MNQWLYKHLCRGVNDTVCGEAISTWMTMVAYGPTTAKRLSINDEENDNIYFLESSEAIHPFFLLTLLMVLLSNMFYTTLFEISAFSGSAQVNGCSALNCSWVDSGLINLFSTIGRWLPAVSLDGPLFFWCSGSPILVLRVASRSVNSYDESSSMHGRM